MEQPLPRRAFLKNAGRGVSLVAIGGAMGALGVRAVRAGQVWQIDPLKCTQCGQCATYCVLDVSAVKCVHEYELCGYCRLCFGYFSRLRVEDDTGAESQLCPTGAITRTRVEDEYHQYDIDESLCNACGKCVKLCGEDGNGSLILQVRHDRCLNCNECNIAAHCPADAFVRIPASQAYLRK